MDTLSHIAWGEMVFRKPHLFAAVAVVSNLPDLVGWVPYGVFGTRHQWRSLLKLKRTKGRRYRYICDLPLPRKYHEHLYLFTHSLTAWGLFTWILEIFFPGYRILSLAYLTHILLDIPFHTGRWSMRPFFPFSDFAVHGQYFWQKGIVVFNIASYLAVRWLVK